MRTPVTRVFVDTWAWYALADAADIDHDLARVANEQLLGDETTDDQRFSYTDCTSFVVMHALELTQAFTADHHFAVLGFELIP